MKRLLLQKCLLLFGCLMTAGLLYGQSAPQLSIADPVGTIPDTLDYPGDSIIAYDIEMTNNGGLRANGLVEIMFRFKDSIDVSMMTVLIDLENGEIFDTTVVDTVKQNDPQLRYGGGYNVIVVWPKAASDIQADDPDTSMAGVFIKDPQNLLLNMDGPVIDLRQRLDLYPNPATDKLHFTFRRSDYQAADVTIYDLSGRILLQQTNIRSELDLANIPEGLYFLHLRFRDGARGTFKLVVDR